MTAIDKLRTLRRACIRSSGIFVRDIGAGLLEVSHNTLALLGLCVVAAMLFVGGRADLRDSFERHALDWLLARQELRDPHQAVEPDLSEPGAVARATAVDPKDLPRQQAAVANWLSRRYRVAPEPVSRLVQEAWSVGQRMALDPTLILAVMAIESSFNPFAQSPVGAQGLMQVMTRIHDDKYQAFGGIRAAFDPVTNLRVGVQVLKESISRAGGLEAGLRYYVGAANLDGDGGYADKVLAEQLHLRKVADGKQVAVNAPLPVGIPPRAAPSAPGRSVAPADEPTPAVAPERERIALLD